MKLCCHRDDPGCNILHHPQHTLPYQVSLHCAIYTIAQPAGREQWRVAHFRSSNYRTQSRALQSSITSHKSELPTPSELHNNPEKRAFCTLQKLCGKALQASTRRNGKLDSTSVHFPAIKIVRQDYQTLSGSRTIDFTLTRQLNSLCIALAF